MVIPFLAKSEGVGKHSHSRNDVELHVEQPASLLPSVDNDSDVVLVALFPGADGGGRKEDEVILAGC